MKLLSLSETRIGRVCLHLLALSRDGKFRWHLAAIRRQLP